MSNTDIAFLCGKEEATKKKRIKKSNVKHRHCFFCAIPTISLSQTNPRNLLLADPTKIPTAVVWWSGLVCCAILIISYLQELPANTPAGAPRYIVTMQNLNTKRIATIVIAMSFFVYLPVKSVISVYAIAPIPIPLEME